MSTTGPPRTNRVTRRGFLAAASAATPFMIVPRHVLGGTGHTPPSEKLNIAGIGVGGQGASNLQQLASENIVALCDVDLARGKPSFERFPNAKQYRDFRVMLDKEHRNIDAVVVATPDHVHAVATMAALHHGKHVYCEKPLTRTVFEARAIAEAAREAKVATQMGNQGMAFEGNRLLNEWIADGAIGTVREVHVWSDRPTHNGKLFWAQGMDAPQDAEPVPETLDWDLWLGPAPYRSYHHAYMPFVWRGWWDFGSGGLGDMGIHNLAPVFSALNLDAPTRIDASSSLVHKDSVPLASTVHYEFPARGDRPAVRLHWYDGGMLPPRPEELDPGQELDREDGIIFEGDRGKILVKGWGGKDPMLIPEARMKEYRQPPKSLPRSIGHHKEWTEACKGRGTTRSNFDFAGPLTEAVLLGTLAVRTGKTLQWDATQFKITNCQEANNLLHYDYRTGWRL